MKTWKIIAKHRWVANATISESVHCNGHQRRFTATICGYRNWRIFCGVPFPNYPEAIIACVMAIRDQIEADGEYAEVFDAVNRYAITADDLARRTWMLQNPIHKRHAEYLEELVLFAES